MMRHHSRRNSSKSMLSSPLRSSRASSPYGSVTCETDAFADNRHNRETMHHTKPFCETVGRGTTSSAPTTPGSHRSSSVALMKPSLPARSAPLSAPAAGRGLGQAPKPVG